MATSQGVEGRWTIHYTYDNGDALQDANALVSGASILVADPAVPVVPCDDAAVERVANYLDPGWNSGNDAMRRTVLDVARGVLRAAGAQP